MKKKRKYISLILVMSLCISMLPSSVFSGTIIGEIGEMFTLSVSASHTHSYSNGICTDCGAYESATLNSDNVYEIGNAGQLFWFAALVNGDTTQEGITAAVADADAVLTANIDMNSEAWTVIGTTNNPFNGTFDGCGYTISNLYINGSSSYIGLFGYVGSGTVQNVTVGGNVTGYQCVGGVVGYNASGTVTNCTNSVVIGASLWTGGVVGYNGSNGTVTNCYNSGSISGIGRIGGIVGYNYGTVKNCCNSGTVTSTWVGYDYAGGVVGQNWGSVTNCCNYGSVSGSTGIGGVIGYNGNSVTNCYNCGTVSGTIDVGGVVGNNSSGSSTTNCYYLTGAATAAIGSDNGMSTSVAGKASTQFASGEVTWLLTGGTTDGTQAWYQNLDNGETVDSYPVLDSTHGTVYYTSTKCDGSSASYSTYSNSSVIHVGSTYNSNGFCTRCGNGYQPATQNNNGVYEISNAGQLFWFASLVNGDTTQEGITAADTSASAVLTTDITIPSGYEWTPIGTKSAPYTGTFDGCGYTVSGMSITTASNYMGLFGYVSAGTIKNLTVSGKIDVTGSSLYAGGIVGTVYDGTLSGLTSTVTINGTDDTMGTFAGVVATAEGTSGIGSTVEKCTYSGSLTASGVLDCIGGIVGYINVATINDCLNTGTVDTTGGTSGKSVTTGIYTSGIVGYCNNTDAVITNCLNLGTISDASSNTSVACYTGAIIGRINSKIGSLSNCYYLSGTADAGCGVNGSKVDVNSNITVKTADEFATGEVAWLLQGDRRTKVWGQDLTNRTTTTDDDLYPVFNDDFDLMVSQISFYYKLGNTVETDPFYIGYTNYAAALASYPTEADATYAYYTYNGETYTQLPTAMIFGDNENVYVEATYAVVQDLGSNLQSSNTDTSALRGSSYSTTLTGVDCYVLPDSITVTSGGTELTAGTDYTYDSMMGEVTISKVMGKIVITADATNISHSYDGGVVTTEPTCTDEGVMTYSCTVCGETRTEAISATGHSYTSVVTDPICTEKGYTTHTCTICGHSYTDNETEATGHSYTSVVTAPTCTEDGYTTHTCSVCGDTYVDSKTEAMGHSWDEGVITTAAGCTAEGVRTYTCTVCGETKIEAISATGHTAGEAVTENEVAATCMTDGSYDSVVYCTVCNAELSRDTVTVPATGHSYTSVVTDPTCTEKGYTTHTCSTCGYSYTDNETEATGHDYTSVVTDPTCTEEGYTTHTCSVCGDTYVDSKTEAMGHSWDEGVITTEATCTTEGVRTYTCTVCGETKTEAILATGHTAGEAVIENEVEATCTTNGSYDSAIYCTVCGAELSRDTAIVSAIGHSYTSVVTDPTCTKEGYTTHICSVCGDTYVDNKTEATGHSWDEGVITTETACVAEGVITYTCTVCGETKTVAISAIGHTLGEAVIENEVAATCTADGSYDSVIYCTVCGAEISRETITVPAIGHSYTSVVIDPTCTEKGYSTHTCSTCGDTYTDSETEATGHTYEATEVIASTYTEKGYTVYTCTGCGDSYEADYTDIRIIDGTDENLAVKTVVQELTEVPEGLREIYESVAELIADLESRVLVSQGYTEENTLVIDVVLQYRINGGDWINATVDNFPNGGITVTLDYPDGTDSSYDFMVVHMFTVTSERLGITAGEVEMPEVTKTDEGLVVTLNGLSPVMISWKEVATEETSISEEETTAIKEETSASEEETTAIEEETSASEEETTAIEEETSASEEETTAIEEETSASEEETTAIEEETSASEEETTVIEEETSASEEETTASEEETSASEEETSASETEATSSENDNSNEAAQTGDAGKLAIWFTVISLIGLTGAQVYRRRKRLS